MVPDLRDLKDGTKVPINIIRRRARKLDGSNPTLLYGYGGYGISHDAAASSARRGGCGSTQGGVYAIANIRGGGEYGESGTRPGNLTKKQNVFDDFTACAEHLIDARLHHARASWPSRAARNGGLLMGAMITQHPELCRAVVSQVGIYDMLRVELDPQRRLQRHRVRHGQGPGAVPGAVRLFALPPRQDGTAYPAVLLLTGANDGRVDPMHSRKMTARAAGGDRARTADPAAHQRRRRPRHRLARWTSGSASRPTQLAFLFDQLGMDAAAAAPR